MKVGYEISFNRYFYKPEPMRTLEEIRADITAVERESEGLLGELLPGVRNTVAGSGPGVVGDRRAGGAGAVRRAPRSSASTSTPR